MTEGKNPYQELERRFRRLGLIDDTLEVLNWDRATMMPEGSAAGRGEQIATLKVLRHELITDPRVDELLPDAEAELAQAEEDEMGAWRRANLREMRRAHLHATAVPADLVGALARASSTCEVRWRAARADSDFQALRPSLEEVLRLVRETAAAKAAALGVAAYDALLDEWEPGGSTEQIDVLFDELAGFLPHLVERVVARQKGLPAPLVPEGPFDAERQRTVGLNLMKIVGFDFARGRLDTSHHPFCGGASDDVRITTRYDERDFTSGLMAVLHETGHAMYQLGLPEAWRYQPVGLARGMSMHESQSLLVEMQACRSREFLAFAAPVLREAFESDGAAWEAENLYRLYTRVTPAFIRVDADEVTYPAHVILRYRLERALIGGDLEIAELPGAWADGMKDLLGIVPPDDRRGCLQDIHWPAGVWGYFPTYTLGAMTAAQLFAAVKRDVGDVLPALGRGDFAPLMDWLRTHVHSRASLLSTEELLRAATGGPLDPGIYRAHLESRYLT
ncbi:MAG: carboxypeptidase M32 [Alphaproteobacteria bacterium]